jgi:hypothetical protein
MHYLFFISSWAVPPEQQYTGSYHSQDNQYMFRLNKIMLDRKAVCMTMTFVGK